MKDWLTIGEFAKRVGVTTKALRVYERLGVLKSHVRGDNRYRYYLLTQVPIGQRLKDLKSLGFKLEEIKNLLQADESIDSEKIILSMRNRLGLVQQQAQLLQSQKNQIEKVLTSLQIKTMPLKAEDRRVVMNLYGNIAIVVTGIEGLEISASYIQRHFEISGKSLPIITWQKGVKIPVTKPYLLIVPESELSSDEVTKINPDVVVIKNISSTDEVIKKSYLKLYSSVGAQMNTVINADDRASVELVENGQIKKTRYIYYSKNSGLKDQIKKIGGVLCTGNEISLFGFNLQKDITINMARTYPYQEEMGLLSSLGAIMTVGFSEKNLYS